MTDLIAELAEVVQIDRDKRLMSSEGERCSADDLRRLFQTKSADFIRAHHAEIEAMARDAARLSWLWRDSGVEGFVNVAGDVHDYALDVADENDREEPTREDYDEGFRRLIDAAMHDSAREGE